MFSLCEDTQYLKERGAEKALLFLWKTRKRDWLDPRTPLLKLQSTRIGTVVEKGFKFLLLQIVKENIQFINSYSLRLILFQYSEFPHLLSYGYARTLSAHGISCTA